MQGQKYTIAPADAQAQEREIKQATRVPATRVPSSDDAALRNLREITSCGLWGESVPLGAKIGSIVVVLLAAVMCKIGLYTAPTLLGSAASAGYTAPPDSPSVVATDRLNEHFPILEAAQNQVLVIVQAVDGAETVLTDAVKTFSLALMDKCETDERFKANIQAGTSALVPAVTGYYTGAPALNLDAEDQLLKGGYVSSDEKTMVISVMATQGLDTYNWWVRDRILKALNEVADPPPTGAEITISGNPAVEQDAGGPVLAEELLHVELCTIPAAILVIFYLVQHGRLMIIPIVSLAVTFFTACSFVLPLVGTKLLPDFSGDIPPAMLSITIALSLDYSLFMLTRYNENRNLTMNAYENVRVLIFRTAETLSCSGTLIAAAFFGAWSIPENNLKGAGVSMGFTTIACFLVSSTLTPALLCIFGRLLTAPVSAPRVILDSLMKTYATEEDGSRTVSLPLTDRSVDLDTARQAETGAWLWLMQKVQMRPRATVAAVFVAFSPFLLALPSLNIVADLYANLPGHLESMQGMHKLVASGLPAGRFDPYTIVVTTDLEPPTKGGMYLPDGNKSAMLTEEGFGAMLSLCDELNSTGGVAAMIGPYWMMDKRVDFKHAKTLHFPFTWRSLYMPMLSAHVRPQAAVLQVHTSFIPKGAGCTQWVTKMRRLLDEWNANNPDYFATLSGGATFEMDIRNIVLGAMPSYVGGVVALVMAICSLLFRSVMLPFRLALALLFTLGVTFGAAVMVYQTPLMWWLIPSLQYHDGICYNAVPIGVCIAVALGLDYDIFLISRIIECRKSGMSDADSIVQGVAKTGGIISGAGIIMALAFSGLLFAPKLMMQQFAFLLVTSVMLDTFVVRTLLVPALMLSAGDMNWWPYQMPPVTVTDLSSEPHSKESFEKLIPSDQDAPRDSASP